MFELKKTAVAVLAFASSTVFAGTMGCTPGNVTVPCEKTAYDVAVHAVYLKPSYTGAFAYPAGGTNGNYHSFDYDYEWGFRVEGSYHFRTGNDVTVNWTWWREGYDFNPDNEFSWSWEPKFNQVNFEFGQHVDFGLLKNIRFHGGLQYFKLEHDILITSQAVNGNRDSLRLRYEGVGPRFGTDMSYEFSNGFEAYVNGAAALTYNQIRYRNRVYAGGVAHNGAIDVGESLSYHRRVVPELEAKIGAKYTYAMASGDITVDAGWLWMNYFNAQHVAIFDTDFGLNGPYVGAKFVGDI